MAELFDKDRKTITRHIQNIYKDEELDENTVCSFFEHTAEDGKKYNVQYYNNEIKPKIAVPIHYGSIVGTKQDATDFINLLHQNIKGIILTK